MICDWRHIHNNNSGGVLINNLGNYKSCRENNSMDYFLLMLPEDFPETVEALYQDLSGLLRPTIGVCAERGCSLSSINQTVAPIFSIVRDNVTNVTVLSMDGAEEEVARIRFQSLGFILGVFGLFLFTVMATWLSSRNGKDKKGEGFLSSFNLISNFKKISKTRLLSPLVQSFDIIRILSMATIVLAHELYVGIFKAKEFKDKDPSYFRYISSSLAVAVQQSGFHSVSLFFFLGGFFAVTSALSLKRKSASTKSRCCSFFLYMVLRRYARLVPTIVFMIAFLNRIVPALMTGPGLMEFLDEDKECTVGSFVNDILLIFWTISYGGSSCAGWLWYLQCDMRMFLLVPPVVFCCKDRRTGVKIFGIIVIASIVLSFTYIFLTGFRYGVVGWFFLYMTSVFRARIYYLGCIFGYVCDVRRVEKKQSKEMVVLDMERQPIIGEATSEIFDKKQTGQEAEARDKSRDVRMVVLSLTAIALMFLWFNSKFQIPSKIGTSPLETSIYSVFTPILVIGFLFLAIYKTLLLKKNLFEKIQKSKFFNILANLSFSMYIFHWTIIMTRRYRFERYPGIRFYQMMGSFVVDFSITVVISLFTCLFLEMPMANLWRVYIEKGVYLKRSQDTGGVLF